MQRQEGPHSFIQTWIFGQVLNQIEKGSTKLVRKILSEFEYMPKNLFPKWHMDDKKLKYRPKGGCPRSALRRPYQCLIAILCILYGEPNTSQFSLSYMILTYYCTNEGISFNWDDILFENITVIIFVVNGAQLATFPIFHRSSYLLDIMCIAHKYPRMGWSWYPSDPIIHVYCWARNLVKLMMMMIRSFLFDIICVFTILKKFWRILISNRHNLYQVHIIEVLWWFQV